ncbi:MAG: hypothetical protein ACJ735_17015 [Actinomycetes bacterium]
MTPRHDVGDFSEHARAARAASDPLDIPVGVAWTPDQRFAPVHVIDGDGASLCEQVVAADLVAIPNRAWQQIETDRRCPFCLLLVTPPE